MPLDLGTVGRWVCGWAKKRPNTQRAVGGLIDVTSQYLQLL